MPSFNEIKRKTSQIFTGDRSSARVPDDPISKLYSRESLSDNNARQTFKDSKPHFKQIYLSGIENHSISDSSTVGQIFDQQFKEALDTHKNLMYEKAGSETPGVDGALRYQDLKNLNSQKFFQVHFSKMINDAKQLKANIDASNPQGTSSQRRDF